MTIYQAPVEDSLFVLNDVLQLHKYNNLPGFADATPDMIEAILGEAGKLADFTVVDRDPYEVGAEGFREIDIWGVVFEGRKVPAN